MLRRCCFCFDLYKGSLLVAACRLAVWLLIFIGTLWVTVQVFSADRGVIVYQAWLDIEQNGHVVALILLVSIVGIAMEVNLFHAIFKWGGSNTSGEGGTVAAVAASISNLSSGGTRRKQLLVWYCFTVFAFFGSLLLGTNFILGVLEIPSRPETGKNFFFDAMCVLIHVVFAFVPEYLLGPRLTPVFIAILLIIHVMLPVMHAYSFLVVRSHIRTEGLLQQARLEAAKGLPFEPTKQPGGGGGSGGGTLNQCQNCIEKCHRAAAGENGHGMAAAATVSSATLPHMNSAHRERENGAPHREREHGHHQHHQQQQQHQAYSYSQQPHQQYYNTYHPQAHSQKHPSNYYTHSICV